MGDALAGETYTGTYKSSDQSFTFTGFHEGQNAIITMTRSNGGIDKDRISMWGRTYRFDEFGHVFDSDFGLVGHLVIPSSLPQNSDPSTGISVSNNAEAMMD